MKSPKQLGLDAEIHRLAKAASLGGRGTAGKAASLLLEDSEIQHLQEYANVVSIKRMGFNDHGPVHMRTVVLNALAMANLLHAAGIRLSLEADEAGSHEDSIVVLLTAGMLHDIGMTVSRADHEHMSVELAIPVIDRVLREVYGGDVGKRVVVRSMALECIVGHMASQRIHSLEAGILLVADGCDMEKGRARIPMMIATESRMGDIHKYSASAIEEVRIEKGEQRPIRITVDMKATVGFFQVEEVLLHKIESSPAKRFIELYAGVMGTKAKCYLGCEPLDAPAAPDRARGKGRRRGKTGSR